MSADLDGPDIETILAEVLIRTDPSQRICYLDQVCGVDIELRRAVEQWAQLIEETVDSLETPAAPLDALEAAAVPFLLPSDAELERYRSETLVSVRVPFARAWAEVTALVVAWFKKADRRGRHKSPPPGCEKTSNP